MSNGKKIVIGLIIVLIIINIILLFVNKDNTSNNKTTEKNNVVEEYENNKSGIDIKGTENVKVESNGTTINKSNDLKSKKEIAGLVIDNIKVAYVNNQTEIRGTITNNTDKDINATSVNANIISENGEIFRTIRVYIGKVKANSTKDLNITIQADVSNMKDIQFE